jgi:hypothetical protein
VAMMSAGAAAARSRGVSKQVAVFRTGFRLAGRNDIRGPLEQFRLIAGDLGAPPEVSGEEVS